MQMVTTVYKAKSYKKAVAAYQKDAHNWTANGYTAFSSRWIQRNRGCLSTLFGSFMFPNWGYLEVTYQLTAHG